MTYYHQLSKEQAEEVLKLPNRVFQNTFDKPDNCGYYGALDKQFGCHFLFRSEKDRVSIYQRCKKCTCRKEAK